MKKTINLFVSLFIFAVLITCKNEVNSPKENAFKFSELSGPYLGQKPPGVTPEIFAPGIVSNGYNEVCISFTNDAKEMFFSIAGQPFTTIFNMKEIDEKWTSPEVANFSGKYSSEFIISPDGNRILISTGAPFDGKGEPKSNWVAWIAQNLNGNWGEAKPLAGALNSGKYSVSYPSLTLNGNMYFFGIEYPGSFGGGDIAMSKPIDGRYESLETMNDSINTENWEIDPYIAPDESYLIFSSNRDGGFGKFDLYISFRNEDDTWTKARNLGEAINSKYNEVHPSVSLDGKYLFFCSNRHAHQKYSKTQLSYNEKIKILESPGNGNEDIYWVDAKIINDLNPNFK